MVGSPWVQSKSLIATGRPAKRPKRLAGLAAAVDFLRPRERGGGIDAKKRLHFPIDRFDAIQKRPGQLDRSDFARLKLCQKFGGGKIDERHDLLSKAMPLGLSRLGWNDQRPRSRRDKPCSARYAIYPFAQHGGHEVTFGVAVRGVGQRLFAVEARPGRIFAKGVGDTSIAWAIGSTPVVSTSPSSSMYAKISPN